MKYIKFILLGSLICGPLQAQEISGVSASEVALLAPHVVKAGAYGMLTALMATGTLGSALLLGLDFFNPVSHNQGDVRPLFRRYRPDFWTNEFPRDASLMTAFSLATVYCFKKTKKTAKDIGQVIVMN
jgi:hypothetical protein